MCSNNDLRGLTKSCTKAYILHIRSNEGGLYRVFVGPSSSKAALIDMMPGIEAVLDVKGRIVRYRIEEDKYLLGG